MLYFLGSDGKLKSHILPNSSLGDYEQSYLTSDASEFVILLNTGREQVRALGLRLKDNLVIHDKTTTLYGSAIINNKFLFVDYESGLGRLDLFNLIDDTTKTLEGYNFDYLRSR